MKRVFIILALLAGALNAGALLSKDFIFNYTSGDFYYKLMSDDYSSHYTGWSFDNCYAHENTPDNYLMIGSGNGTTNSPYALGSVTTPSLNIEGNAMLIIEARLISGKDTAKLDVKVDDKPMTSLTPGTSMARLSAVVLEGITRTSKIKLESNGGKYYLKSIKVYNIEEFFFYESFDNVSFKSGALGIGTDGYLTSDLCDDITSVVSGNVGKGDGSIYFYNNNAGSYTTPALSIIEGKNYILSFKIYAKSNNSSGQSDHGIFISSDGGALLGGFNSTDFTSLSNSQVLTFKLNPLKSKDEECKIIVSGMANNTTITFKGEACFLDEITLTPVQTISLDEKAADNQTTINNNAFLRNVELKRTLGSDYWNTLCLPFDITPASFAAAIGATANVQTLTTISSGGEYTFNRVADNTTVAAGTPFIVKVGAAVSDPLFANVAVKAVEPAAVTSNGYGFQGIFSPTDLATDGTQVFLSTDGNLYIPAVGNNKMNGFRAYFISPTAISPTEGGTRIFIDGGNSSAILQPTVTTASPSTKNTVDMSGRRHSGNGPLHGVYIRDGRKVLK